MPVPFPASAGTGFGERLVAPRTRRALQPVRLVVPECQRVGEMCAARMYALPPQSTDAIRLKEATAFLSTALPYLAKSKSGSVKKAFTSSSANKSSNIALRTTSSSSEPRTVSTAETRSPRDISRSSKLSIDWMSLFSRPRSFFFIGSYLWKTVTTEPEELVMTTMFPASYLVAPGVLPGVAVPVAIAPCTADGVIPWLCIRSIACPEYSRPPIVAGAFVPGGTFR